jgi:hypothetical protein
MNPKTEQLLATLEIITEGLLYSTAGDCPIDPFVWEVTKQGEFNLVNFLTDRNFLQTVESKFFDRAWQRAIKALKHSSKISQKQQPPALIKQLQSHLADLEFYCLGGNRNNLCCQMIAGKTADGSWVGLTTLRCQPCTFGKPLSIKDGYTSPQAEFLRARIEPSIEEMKLLLPTKRGRQPEIVWEVAESQTKVLIKLLNSSQFVESYEYFSFYPQIKDFLTSQLQQLQSYVIGSSIYTVGQIADGDWLGIHTSGYWD